MKKQVNISQFEQVFSEISLKKGLSLVKNNRVSVTASPVTEEYHFRFDDKEQAELTLKRKGDKIIFYQCSCHKKECEHICAAIFCFQRETLNDLITQSARRKNKQEDLFKKYSKRIKLLIRETYSFPDEKIDLIKLYSSLGLQNKTDKYFINLALLNEISSLSNSQIIANEKELQELINKLKKGTEIFFRKSLNSIQQRALYEATLNSLSSAKKFNSGLFSFLIPYAALLIKDKKDIEILKTALDKRKANFTFPGALDLRLVAQFHLIRAEASLSLNKTHRLKENNCPEYYIMMAEHEYCLNKPNKAFKNLRSGYSKIKNRRPAGFVRYMEYIIQKANEFKDESEELFFIKQMLIFDPFINPKYLVRIKELLDEGERKEYVDEILSALHRSHHNTFDKKSEILLSENRLDDLIKEISRQHNKFRLMNEAALKKLPLVNEDLLKTYVNQFKNAIADASETHYQEKIFNESRKFINHLPEEEQKKLVNALLGVVGKHSYIRSCLLKHYPLTHTA